MAWLAMITSEMKTKWRHLIVTLPIATQYAIRNVSSLIAKYNVDFADKAQTEKEQNSIFGGNHLISRDDMET